MSAYWDLFEAKGSNERPLLNCSNSVLEMIVQIVWMFVNDNPHEAYDLHDHLKNRVGTIEKRSFIAALESALRHLHTRGLAHNDLTPQNILVSKEGVCQ
jgi:serine/threonine protein kinase